MRDIEELRAPAGAWRGMVDAESTYRQYLCRSAHLYTSLTQCLIDEAVLGLLYLTLHDGSRA
jgi:hypothetical protein